MPDGRCRYQRLNGLRFALWKFWTAPTHSLYSVCHSRIFTLFLSRTKRRSSLPFLTGSGDTSLVFESSLIFFDLCRNSFFSSEFSRFCSVLMVRLGYYDTSFNFYFFFPGTIILFFLLFDLPRNFQLSCNRLLVFSAPNPKILIDLLFDLNLFVWLLFCVVVESEYWKRL